MPAPNASYSITMRVELDTDPRSIGRLTTAVGDAAGTVAAVDVVESTGVGMGGEVTGWRRARRPWSDETVVGVPRKPGRSARRDRYYQDDRGAGQHARRSDLHLIMMQAPLDADDLAAPVRAPHINSTRSPV
jgi:hypothetical protein